MAENKRYFWLKFKEDFFNQKEIKKLRKIAGGDTYTIIYLKMQLKTIRTNGILEYEGLEDTFYEELALDLDEDVENVKLTLAFLSSHGLLEQINTDEYILPKVLDCIGSETKNAERVRKCRANKQLENQKVLQCNTLVTKCNTDIDIEKDIDIDIDNKLNEFNLYNIYNNWQENLKCDCQTKTDEKCQRRSSYNINGKNYCNQHSKPILSEFLRESKVFQKPTVEEINQYCTERNNNLDPQHFFDFYESKGWKVGKEPMKDWRACVRTWEKNKSNTNVPVQRNEGNAFFEILRKEGKMQ